MNDINILNNFFLYRVITQVAYISEKHPDLSYYDLDTCELVIVDQEKDSLTVTVCIPK